MTDLPEPITPRFVTIASEYGSWMRRFLALVAAVNVVLSLVLIREISSVSDLGSGNRAILCAITIDDAAANPAVLAVYREHCE